jgi:hypothetical protein
MMADLIDFPSWPASPDDLPQPGDDYRAFAPPAAHPHITLIFVFPDDSMNGFRFSALEQFDYAPAASPRGLDVLNLHFAFSESTDVRVEGRNLHALCSYLGEQQTRWLRMLPAGQEVKDPGAAVITRIAIEPGNA